MKPSKVKNSNHEFNPQNYWENRLSENQNLRGTGHRAFSVEYNHWLYQAQKDSLDTLMERHKIDFDGKDVLDIGSGFGFYVDYFLSRSPRSVTGIDITEVSINYLTQNFPKGIFWQKDISAKDLSFDKNFDFISAISVLIHITDDKKFDQAISNICRLLKPGGYGLITDSFTKSLFPNVKHVRLRNLSGYQKIFREFDVQVVEIFPVFYFLDKASFPGVGGRFVETLQLGRFLYELDRWLKTKGVGNFTSSKMLLAVKTQ